MATRLKGRVGEPVHLDFTPPEAEVTVTEKTMSVKKEKVTIVGDETTRETEMSPLFTRQLFPVVEAAPGSNVRLECDVDGMPEPQVSWTHNGQPIAHSQRRELFYSGRTCTLVIRGVTPMDAGDYICRALNALGDVTTKCTVRIGDQSSGGVPQTVPANGVPGSQQMDGAPHIVPQMTAPVQTGFPSNMSAPFATEQVVPLQQGGHMPLGATFQLDLAGAMPGMAYNQQVKQQRSSFVSQNGQQTSAFQSYQASSFQSNTVGFSSTQQQNYQQQHDTSSYVRQTSITGSGRSTPIKFTSRQTSASPIRSGRTTPVGNTQVLVGHHTPIRASTPTRRSTTPTMSYISRQSSGERSAHSSLDRSAHTSLERSHSTHTSLERSQHSSLDRSVRHSSTDRSIRQTSIDRNVRQTSIDRTVRQTSQDRSGRTTPNSTLQEPPRFTIALRDININDGDRTVFKVQWRGIPRPTIKWYFNSEEIKPSDDFQIKIDILRCESTLTIKEVFPDDEGEYMCKAESMLGAAVTHCHLFVRLPSSSEEDISKISKSPETVLKKSSVYQEHMQIPQRSSFSETISIETQKRFKEFQMEFGIPDQKAERSEIIARQQASLRGMKMHVDVELPTPKTFAETKMINLSKTVNVPSQTQTTQSTQKTSLSKQLAYLKTPITQQRRFSETVSIDQSKAQREPVQVTFSLPEQRRRLEKSAIQIRQQAALRGMKMEVEIAEKERKVSEVTHMSKKKAQAIGTQRQEFHLQLDGGAPPHFTIDLTSAKVMDGEEVKFNAKVIGQPMPDVTWYKNGKVIVENPDFHTTYDKSTGVCTLHILEVFPQDTGEYRAVAINQYGRAVTGATLQVDVFEYVPDSEEASASAAESLPDRQVSEDEMEFLERTQAFIANMQKLRQELQEEQVNEEEVVMTEEYHEETVQMAEVKWQIPRRGVEMELQLATPENVQELVEETIECSQEERVQAAAGAPQVQQQAVMQGIAEEMQVEVALESHQVQQAEESRVTQLEEITQPEIVQEDVARVPSPEESTQEQVIVQLSQSELAEATQSLVQPQEENLQPEMVQESMERIPTPEGAGEEQVTVQLSMQTKETAKGAMVMPQEERLTPEGVQESTERIPTPQDAGEEQVNVAYAQPAVVGAKEHFTGLVEERHTPEEEEDMYFELPEPELKGEEVVVELSNVLVQERQLILTETQIAQIEVMETGEANAEFTEEDTNKEEIKVSLDQAELRQPKQSLVGIQEQCVTPIQVEDANIVPPVEESTEGQKVEVSLDRASRIAPKGSMVGHIEDVVEVQTIGEDIEMLHEEQSLGEQVNVDLQSGWVMNRPLQLAGPVMESVKPERPGSQYDDSIKEMRMIPTYVQPEYEPAVLEWYRLEIRVAPKAFDEQTEISESQLTEELSMQQIKAQYELDQQQMQQAVAQQKQFQADMQRMEWRSEAASEQHTEFHVQEVRQQVEQSQASFMSAQSEQQVIRAATEVTEEREVILETTTEEIEVIRPAPVQEDVIAPDMTDRVHAPPKQPLMAPVFEMPLSDVTVADGETAILECKVTGVPRPEVYWYIDEMEIKVTTEIRIEYTIEGYCRLFITDVLQDDEGEYKVKAVNQAGTCISTAYLTVLPPEHSEPSSPSGEMMSETVVSETFRKMEMDISMQTRKEMSIVEVPIPVQPEAPKIIRHLEHKEIFESMAVILECHVTGNPEPEISWFQDGKKLTTTENMEITYVRGVCRLHIKSVTIQDEAEYTLEARNEYGIATSVCELLVERRTKEETTVHEQTMVTHEVQQTSLTDIQVVKKESRDMSATHQRAVQQVVREQQDVHHAVQPHPQDTQQSVLTMQPKQPETTEQRRFSTSWEMQVEGQQKVPQEVTLELALPEQSAVVVTEPVKKVITKKEVTRIHDTHAAEVTVPAVRKTSETTVTQKQIEMAPTHTETHSTEMVMEVQGQKRNSVVTVEVPVTQSVQVHTTATTDVTREITAQELRRPSQGMFEEITETVRTQFTTVISGDIPDGAKSMAVTEQQHLAIQDTQQNQEQKKFTTTVVKDSMGQPKLEEVTLDFQMPVGPDGQRTSVTHHAKMVDQEVSYKPAEEMHSSEMLLNIHGQTQMPELTLDVQLPEGTGQIIQSMKSPTDSDEDGFATPEEDLPDELKPQVQAFSEMAEQVSAQMIAELMPQLAHHPEVTATKEIGQIFVGGRKISLQATVKDEVKSEPVPAIEEKPIEKPKEAPKVAEKPKGKGKPTAKAPAVEEEVEQELVPIPEKTPLWKKNILIKQNEKIIEKNKQIQERRKSQIEAEEAAEAAKPKEEPKEEPKKPEEPKPDDNMPAWKKAALERRKSKEALKVEEEPKKPEEPKPDDNMPAWKKAALERRKSKEALKEEDQKPKEEPKPKGKKPTKKDEKPKEEKKTEPKKDEKPQEPEKPKEEPKTVSYKKTTEIGEIEVGDRRISLQAILTPQDIQKLVEAATDEPKPLDYIPEEFTETTSQVHEVKIEGKRVSVSKEQKPDERFVKQSQVVIPDMPGVKKPDAIPLTFGPANIVDKKPEEKPREELTLEKPTEPTADAPVEEKEVVLGGRRLSLIEKPEEVKPSTKQTTTIQTAEVGEINVQGRRISLQAIITEKPQEKKPEEEEVDESIPAWKRTMLQKKRKSKEEPKQPIPEDKSVEQVTETEAKEITEVKISGRRVSLVPDDDKPMELKPPDQPRRKSSLKTGKLSIPKEVSFVLPVDEPTNEDQPTTAELGEFTYGGRRVSLTAVVMPEELPKAKITLLPKEENTVTLIQITTEERLRLEELQKMQMVTSITVRRKSDAKTTQVKKVTQEKVTKTTKEIVEEPKETLVVEQPAEPQAQGTYVVHFKKFIVKGKGSHLPFTRVILTDGKTV